MQIKNQHDMSATLVKEVKEHFIKKFKTHPLLIFSPGRINIIGEHTDYNGGFVFPAAVDKGIAAAIQKSDAGNCTAIALDLDSTIEFELDKLKPSKETKLLAISTSFLKEIFLEVQVCHLLQL